MTSLFLIAFDLWAAASSRESIFCRPLAFFRPAGWAFFFSFPLLLQRWCECLKGGPDSCSGFFSTAAKRDEGLRAEAEGGWAWLAAAAAAVHGRRARSRVFALTWMSCPDREGRSSLAARAMQTRSLTRWPRPPAWGADVRAITSSRSTDHHSIWRRACWAPVGPRRLLSSPTRGGEGSGGGKLCGASIGCASRRWTLFWS